MPCNHQRWLSPSSYHSFIRFSSIHGYSPTSTHYKFRSHLPNYDQKPNNSLFNNHWPRRVNNMLSFFFFLNLFRSNKKTKGRRRNGREIVRDWPSDYDKGTWGVASPNIDNKARIFIDKQKNRVHHQPWSRYLCLHMHAIIWKKKKKKKNICHYMCLFLCILLL